MRHESGVTRKSDESGGNEETRSELLAGTLALMVLRTLAPGPMHGYGIAQRIQQVSRDVLQVNQGSLYPALLRLEQRGLISSRWGTSENNRRARFYSLTRTGRRELEAETGRWLRFSEAMGRLLEA
ncbi:MAG TPA: PadR family transcriptional regulator [Thermoanaerobaculia bacterium]|nr:PadR family transcriptional regulator [Thermoanaerobaculia bacterium]